MNQPWAPGAEAAVEELAAFPFLEAYLAPLAPVLARPEITDILINEPGRAWIEAVGQVAEPVDVPELTAEQLWRLARQIASFCHQGISREHPLLSARLPDGARVQVVAPPATRGSVAIAIRRHVMSDLALADYATNGAFDGSGKPRSRSPDIDAETDPISYLREAVRQRKNILISGGTSTGKTTFLNALLREVPPDERLILIEDTPELILRHANSVGLVAVKGELGEARVTADDLLQASLRMRPDRIILGELRGSEAYTFLRAVNTGHPGSMTTIHANSPEGAFEQLALIVQANAKLGRSDILDYVRFVVDVSVQLERINGRRVIECIEEKGRRVL
jgi:type IV secretion system protein VirB11